jgi:hypothetical protein
LGDILDAAFHTGLAQGRTSDTKPASILCAGGQGNVSHGLCARSLAITAPWSLLSDLCALAMGFRGPAERPLHRPFYAGTPAWNGGCRSTFPHRALRGTLDSAPVRKAG